MAGVASAFFRPKNAQCIIRQYADFASQPVHRQPPHERLGLACFAIDQHIIVIRPQDKVEQRLALRAQQSRPERHSSGSILRHQPLQKPPHILACFGWRKANNSSVEQAGVWHR